MANGRWVVRIWRSGKTVDMSKYWAPSQQRPRSSRTGGSSERKQDVNGAQAVRRLARSINCNFSRRDVLLTLHYTPEGMDRVGGDRAEGERQMMRFIKRCAYRYRKRGVTFRAIGVTSEKSSRTLEPCRLHHHLVVSGDLIAKPEGSEEYLLAGEPLSKIWGFGTVDVQQLHAEDDYTGLAVYLCRQAGNKPNEKKWHATRNLLKPDWQDVELDRASVAEYNRHRRRGMPKLCVDHEGRLLTPPKCATCETGNYIPAIGTHYLRFRLPHKQSAKTRRYGGPGLPPAIPKQPRRQKGGGA